MAQAIYDLERAEASPSQLVERAAAGDEVIRVQIRPSHAHVNFTTVAASRAPDRNVSG